MSFFVPGAPPVNSTSGQLTDPSTSVICAELDSSNFLSTRGGIYSVQMWCGCSTVAEFWLEHCVSTGLGSSAIAERTIVRVSANQTPQYIKKFKLANNDRIRVRVGVAITGTQTAEVKLQAEEIS